MNNLTTRKIVLGMLMALMLVFSVQSIADPLRLTATSDTTQVKEPNDAPFEIKFSVRMNSNAIAYNDESPRRRVTDANTGAVRIDSSGYMVTTVNGTERRTLDGNPTLTPTGNGASPVLGSPHPAYTMDTSDPPQGVRQAPAPILPYYVDTSGNVVDSNGAAVYIRRGTGDRTNADPYTYTRAKSDPNRVGNPVPLADRFDYNEEAILIAVAKLSGEAFGALSAGDMDISIKGGNYFISPQDLLTSAPKLTEMSGLLNSSMTLVCNTTTEGTYKITIMDATDEEDFPRNIADGILTIAETAAEEPPSGIRRSKETFTLHVTAEGVVVGDDNKVEARGAAGGVTPYLRVDTAKEVEKVSDDFVVTSEKNNLEIRYKIISGRGTLYAAENSKEGIYRGPSQDLTVHESSHVFLNTNGTTNEVAASIAGSARRTHTATIVYEYSGTDAPGTTPTTPTTPTPTAPVAPSVPTTVTGPAGGTATLTVTAPATATVTAGGLGNTFLSTNVGSFTRSGTTFTSRLTLPNQVANYSLSVFVNNTRYPVTVSVTAAAAQPQTGGTLTVAVNPFSGAPGTTATVTVTATDSNNQPANATVSLTATGGTLARSSVLTGTTGTTTVTLTRGSTVGTENNVTVSASNYTSVSGRFIIAGPAVRDTTVGEAAELDVYDGNNQNGSLNSPLAEPFIVEVVDANDNPVEDARVRFRTTIGSGRFSPRTPRTDEDGFAETTFTPTSTGRIRVVATVTGVDSTAAFIVQGGEPADALVKVSGDDQSGTPGNALASPFVVEVQDEDGEPLAGHTVTFAVTAGGGSLSETSATADEDGRAQTTLTLGSAPGVNSVEASVTGVDPVTFSTSIDAKILVAAANRPVMYWIAGGGLYSLSGAKEAKIAESANGVAVGGGKIYWTSQTSASSGAINSANLDGTNAATLTTIQSVPVGIAVDTAGSKLYWTNARGRIQSASLNGSSIQNVVQNLSDPTDIVVSNGFIYWTEGGNSVRRVNISGQPQITRPVATNLDSVGGLAVGGGKVYWTEMTSASAGTVNGADLDGTNFGTLATLLSAPMGISVDTAGSKLYWTNARGRVQSANLNGSMIKNVVEGLISPSKLAIGGSNTAEVMTRQPTAKKDNAKYDVNGDGKVDNVDASLVASGLDTGNAKYDVDGDGTVNFLDLLLIFDNRDDDAAAAPTLVSMKLNAIQIDRIEEQIDLLIATNDRSPAALRTLVYMQQLLATARPEKTQLFANYPNPFNPETWIPYELATDTHVRLTIYNTQGVVIRTLQFGHQSAGYYTDRDRAAYWDGRNALGEQVASGLYFYQLETDEMSSMRKMVILK